MQVIARYKCPFLLVLSLMMVIILSSCASGASAPTNPQSVPDVSGTISNTPASSSTSGVTSAGNLVVKTATATVDKKSEAILTDANGRTLYYFTQDALHNIACTTGCIDSWPPLLYSGTGAVSASTSLPGTLTTEKTANGNQVVYNGHYLYTYSGDAAAGDTNGQGIGGKWYVATPNVSENQPVHTGGS
jgi:predicted lipoprotein with Yx(FWY)xxD motif